MVSVANWARGLAAGLFSPVDTTWVSDVSDVAVYPRPLDPSSAKLPLLLGIKLEGMIDKSYLAWLDFNKLRASEHVQVLDDTVKIKGPVIIFTQRLSLSNRIITLLAVPTAIGYINFSLMLGILQNCQHLMSVKTYRRFQWAAALISTANAGITLVALHILLNCLPGIYFLKKQSITKIA